MKILFLGGDMRMGYARDILSDNGYDTSVDTSSRYPAIVLPVPLTKNGTDIYGNKPIPLERVAELAEPGATVLAGGECPKLREICNEHSLRLVNYFACESLTLRNAALTAEAALALLVESSPTALLGADILITGYGRISRELAFRLRACGSSPVIAARRRESRTEAELHGFRSVAVEEIPEILGKFPFIVNTVPAPLFSGQDFAAMREDSVFLELASVREQHPENIRYIYAMGLPGKYSPKTAGKFIAEEILRVLP